MSDLIRCIEYGACALVALPFVVPIAKAVIKGYSSQRRASIRIRNSIDNAVGETALFQELLQNSKSSRELLANPDYVANLRNGLSARYTELQRTVESAVKSDAQICDLDMKQSLSNRFEDYRKTLQSFRAYVSQNSLSRWEGFNLSSAIIQ